MKKSKEKNIKIILGLLIGIIFGTGTVFAANSLNASSITIDKTNGKLAKITGDKLNNALDYLYEQSQKTNMITIESNVLHLSQTYLGIAYLDPTDLTKKCSSEDAKANRNNDENHTITGVKTGCMKWYIFKEDNNNYYAILDHNTTATVKWNSSNDNSDNTEILNVLSADTTGWDEDLSPRLITANEVAEITGADWNSSTATSANWFYLDSKDNQHAASGQGTSEFAWLFDNLGWNDQYGNSTTYGGNEWDGVNSSGYWTSTPVTGAGSNVWIVYRRGNLDNYNANYPNHGVRPVITISKS